VEGQLEGKIIENSMLVHITGTQEAKCGNMSMDRTRCEKIKPQNILDGQVDLAHSVLGEKIDASEINKWNLRTEYEHIVNPFSGPYDKIQPYEQRKQHRDDEDRVDEK